MSREEPALERLAAALDELAERDAATLVAEAHIEARARVRGLLAEAIAERLLARAESELGALRGDRPPSAGGPPGANAPLRTPSALCGSPTPRAPASTATPAEPARKAEPGASGWYVYGIVEEGFQAPAVVGVDETQPLQVVCGAGLGALASRVPLNEFGEDALRAQLEDVVWLERIARRHERILESVRELRATVVPMRLFTIYESETSLVQMLTRERAYLEDALLRLSCRAEWGVKLYAQAGAAAGTDADAGEPSDGEPEGEAGPGESYMQRRRIADRRLEEAGRRADARRDHAHERLRALAVEARVNPLQPPELDDHDGTMLMNGVYLVDDDELGAFQDAVAEITAEYAQAGIDVVLTGPWPPYNFVNSSEEAGV